MKTLISQLVSAHAWSITVTPAYRDECSAKIRRLESMLPSGSGIDNGTTVIECTPTKVVMECGFHHMDEHGYYNGWTHHRITVTPTFAGIVVKVSGRDRNGIKEYLADTYATCLESEVIGTTDSSTRPEALTA